MRERIGAAEFTTLAAVPALLAAWLAVFWVQSGRVVLGGDEPHYVIMAESLIEDGDLRLQNNYDIECVAVEFYGCMEPHGIPGIASLGPYHQAGVSAVIAWPYTAAGVVGARLAMVAIAALLPMLLLSWLRSVTGLSPARWLTAGAALSLPLVFGASAIYPDLAAGVVIFGVTAWMLGPDDRRSASAMTAAVVWLSCGLLCWLNLKFIAASVVLTAWYAFRHAPASKRTILLMSLVLVGPLLLAAFHYWTFGNPLGARGTRELTDSPLRAAMIFLGLHLDQGQGIFFQHPLLTAGIPALVWWARRDAKNAMWWLILYAALTVPNSLQMGRYGGGGPAGRYAWTAAWLWIVPIGCASAVFGHRALKAIAAASLMYQAALAVRWIPRPTVLMPIYEEALTARNSLFPASIRGVVPSFYDWSYSAYLTNPANVIAVAAMVGLAVWAWRVDRVPPPSHEAIGSPPAATAATE
jgi:hypothetical protein